MAFDQDTLDLLDKSIEVDMVTPRRDGSLSKRPIWIVVVDGEPYVRSYRGPSGAWYQRTLADGRATLEAAGQSIDVGAEPEHGDDINERVSEAFRVKYAEREPGPTEEMVSGEVTATTLRLTG